MQCSIIAISAVATATALRKISSIFFEFTMFYNYLYGDIA